MMNVAPGNLDIALGIAPPLLWRFSVWIDTQLTTMLCVLVRDSGMKNLVNLLFKCDHCVVYPQRLVPETDSVVPHWR